MTLEEKESVITAWNEVNAALDNLDDHEYFVKERLDNASKHLGKLIKEEDL